MQNAEIRVCDAIIISVSLFTGDFMTEKKSRKIRKILFRIYVAITSIFAFLFIGLVISFFIDFEQPEEEPKEKTLVYDLSIFDNQFVENQNAKYQDAEVRFLNEIGYINDNKYNVTRSSYSAYESRVFWRVDLSKLILCYTIDDVNIYSSNGELDNDILIVNRNNENYFLVKGNILQQYNYEIDDFNILECSDPDIVSYQKKLWEDHLSNRYLITTVCSSELPEYVSFQLKNHPELIYSFSYFKFDDFYCSPYSYTRRTGAEIPEDLLN